MLPREKGKISVIIPTYNRCGLLAKLLGVAPAKNDGDLSHTAAALTR